MSVLLELSAQRALLGNVSAKVAAVLVRLEGTRVQLCALFFENAGEADREQMEEAATEVIADFPKGYSIETRCECLGDWTPELSWHCVFLRAEAAPYVSFKKV